MYKKNSTTGRMRGQSFVELAIVLPLLLFLLIAFVEKRCRRNLQFRDQAWYVQRGKLKDILDPG